MSDGVAILPDDAVGQRIKVKDVQSLPKAVIRIPTVLRRLPVLHLVVVEQEHS